VNGRAVKEGIFALQEAKMSNQLEQATLFASTLVFVNEPDAEARDDSVPELERLAKFPSALQGAVCKPVEASEE
jgi:hypothetical protein